MLTGNTTDSRSQVHRASVPRTSGSSAINQSKKTKDLSKIFEEAQQKEFAFKTSIAEKTLASSMNIWSATCIYLGSIIESCEPVQKPPKIFLAPNKKIDPTKSIEHAILKCELARLNGTIPDEIDLVVALDEIPDNATRPSAPTWRILELEKHSSDSPSYPKSKNLLYSSAVANRVVMDQAKKQAKENLDITEMTGALAINAALQVGVLGTIYVSLYNNTSSR